jgi:hypothetical protein
VGAIVLRWAESARKQTLLKAWVAQGPTASGSKLQTRQFDRADFRLGSARALLGQLIEQGLGVFQVGRVEALGEAGID